MKVVVDKKGHNYYVPFYFCLYLTIGFICLVIAVFCSIELIYMLDSEL